MSKKKKPKKKSTAVSRAKNTAKVATVALSLGAVIGAVAGLLSAPKKGSELKSDLEREGEKLLKKMKQSKKEMEAVVEKHFGEVSPQTMKLYTKSKAEILARVAKYKDGMTKGQYDKIVDSVMKKVSKSKKMQKPLQNLGKEFKKTWKELKEIL